MRVHVRVHVRMMDIESWVRACVFACWGVARPASVLTCSPDLRARNLHATAVSFATRYLQVNKWFPTIAAITFALMTFVSART